MPIRSLFKTTFFCLLALTCLGMGQARADGLVPGAVYADPKAPAEARVSDLLGRLTQPEKLSLMALIGYGDPFKLDLPAIPRLGVPSLRTIDSPAGLRDGQATAFPMEVVMASTWDPALVRQVGQAIGEEARAKDRQIVYGPCVNIQRTPQGGRYFENFSEDPWVNAQMTVAYVDGMQSRGVAACIKHFACNNQETGRHDINVIVGERALHEIYLPAFRAAATQANVWALMPALSRLNGTYCAENKPLLSGLLETQWHWNGLVVSDWGAVHSTAATLNAGTDVEMPQPQFFSATNLTRALSSGKVTQAEIDDAVRRVLRLMVRTGTLDPLPASSSPTLPDPAAAVNSPAHQALARRVALEGITLLKNKDSFLPLDKKTIKSIAVVGPNAQNTPLGGRWSAEVHPFYQVSILDGIQKKAGAGVTVTYAEGCPRTGSGTPDDLAKAVALAKSADAAVVVVGTDNNYEGEEMDIPNLHLPGDQEKLIQAVAAVNPHTLVVLNCGTPLSTEAWLPRVPGLLETWYSGQEGGSAAADIIFGDADPSGRLTGTWAYQREDYSDWGNYPGADGYVNYMEGIYVGYRHFDRAKIKPLFPFGYGLSYTAFAFHHLQMPRAAKIGTSLTVRLTVQNTGKRAGAEVVQLYLRPLNPKVDRPVRELKSFARVSLRPGETKSVTLTLPPDAFRYWNVKTHGWQTDPGKYALDAGASSRDLRLSGVLHLETM